MHIGTLYLANFALSAVIGITLGCAAWRRSSALASWAAAMGLLALGFGLIGLRGQISDVLSIVGGNTALAGYLALLVAGVYRFQQRPVPLLVVWGPILATFVGFTLLFNNMGGRLLLSSLGLSLQIALALVPLVSQRRQVVGFGQYILMAGLLLDLICLVARAANVLYGYVPASLFEANFLYGLILFANLVALLLIMAGTLLMVHERTLSQLSESESRYRRLIESAQEGICILAHGRCQFVNPRMAQMLGIPASTLLNAPFTEFVHPEDRSAALAKYSQRVKGAADGMVHDIRLLTANGGNRWFRVSGMRIQWEGQPATLNFVGDIHERKLAEERTRQLAYHDELTQLPNRRMFAERLQNSINSHDLQNRFICVMFIDINKLKSLNDLHGHKAGDLLLVEVSRRLGLHAGEHNTVARLGGDEFVVLLPSLGNDYIQARQHAMQKAEQLQAALCAPYYLQSENNQEPAIQFHSSASIGVYVFDPHQAKADDILNKADAAMYRAKKEGQGVLFFDDKKAA